MGGRGGASGLSAVKNTSEYKNAYDIEMENAKDFVASYALEKEATKEAIGYEMYSYQSVTGKSLIAETRSEVEELKRAYKTANQDGKSYGMSQTAIDGMKAGIKEKIALRQKAIEIMTNARAEYEKYKKQADIGNAKAKKRKGRWM